MTRTSLAALILLLMPALAFAASGPELLFAGKTGRLSAKAMRAMYEAVSGGDLRVSRDGKTLLGPHGSSVAFIVNFVDLNGDGVNEVFISGGNNNTSSITGTSVWAFVRDKSGHYRLQFDVPAAEYRVLKTKHLGFHDVQFLDPGFCRPVWRWNGRQYAFYKSLVDPHTPKEFRGCDHR